MAHSRGNVVYIASPPEDLLDRKTVFGLFSTYGTILKIYIEPEGKEVKIYYSNPDHVVDAISTLNGIPPYKLKLTNRSEYLRKYPSTSSITQQDLSPTTSMYGDDIDAVQGGQLYTVHGQNVTTFQSDNGEVFVSVAELKKLGFQLFKENFRPTEISDEEYLSQLKSYLSFKARKYLKMFPHTVNPHDAEKVVNDVIRTFTSPPSKNGPQRSNNNNNNKVTSSPSNVVVQPSKHNPTFAPEKPDSPSNNNVSSLRKPHVAGNVASPNVTNAPRMNNASVPLFKRIPDYDVVDFPLDEALQACVTHVVSPQRCYVVQKSRHTTFKNLLLRTAKEAQRAEVTTPEIGKICLAQFEGEWYRAVVLQTTPLKVMYIDFGNWNDVPVTEIRSISEKLASEPGEAVCLNFGTNTPPKPLKFDDIITITAFKQNSDRSVQVKLETATGTSVDNSVKNNNKTFSQSGTSNGNNYKKNFPGNGSPVTTLNNQTNDKENAVKPDKNNFSVGKGNVTEEKPTQKVAESKVSTPKPVAQPVLNNGIKPANKLEENVRKSSFSAAKNLLKMTALAQQKRTTLNPDRKTVMDNAPPGAGVLQYTEMLKDKCICFVCPHSALDEINLLDNIGDESSDDLEYNAKVGDSVAVYKEDETKWVRGTVINMSNNKFTVALIDYGMIVSADKVRQLPKQFLEVPEFVCVCAGSERFVESTDKDTTMSCEVVAKNKLKITWPDGTSEEVTCERWDPFLASDLAAPAEKPEVIVTTRPKNPTFTDGEFVVIVNFYDGKLLVRNKNCKIALTDLQKSIANYSAVPLKEEPKQKQIVLCPFENGSELHRAAVLKLNGKYCDVEYLDIGTIDSVLVDSLKSITETLAKEELTLAPITLKGFQEEQYTEAAFELIQKYCDDKDKFILKKISGNVYDLLTSGGKESLSKILQSCGKSDRILFADIPKPNIKIGINQLLCINNSVENSNNLITFMSTNGLSQDDIDKILTVTAELFDTNPYMPSLDEICFAEFEGEWYRGRVIETNKEVDQHKILYIDYGNEGVVSSAEVRKLVEGFETVPPLGIRCKIEDDNGIEVAAESQYNVEILSFTEDVYSAKICEQL